MDTEHSTEMFKHLEKQSEVLMEAYRSMSHDLHKLQVEEEMLKHKLYEHMCMNGLLNKEKKIESTENANKSRKSDTKFYGVYTRVGYENLEI